MALRRFCDRCQEEIEGVVVGIDSGQVLEPEFRVTFEDTKAYPDSKRFTKLELCKSCRRDFDRWVRDVHKEGGS